MKSLKSLALLVACFCAASLAKADFLIDLGVKTDGVINIYLNASSGKGYYDAWANIGSNIAIYDITDLTQDTNLSDLVPAAQIGFSWQSGGWEDFMVQDLTYGAGGITVSNASEFFEDWGYADMTISGLAQNHHYVAYVSSGESSGYPAYPNWPSNGSGGSFGPPTSPNGGAFSNLSGGPFFSQLVNDMVVWETTSRSFLEWNFF